MKSIVHVQQRISSHDFVVTFVSLCEFQTTVNLRVLVYLEDKTTLKF